MLVKQKTFSFNTALILSLLRFCGSEVPFADKPGIGSCILKVQIDRRLCCLVNETALRDRPKLLNRPTFLRMTAPQLLRPWLSLPNGTS